VGTGVALAWLYRRRRYWASVTAHATVNVVAWIALVTSS
jgi:membrane protease YdiL (CAAX protease family)